MRQLTLASASFDKHSKQTRRAKFLAEMDQVVPWRELCAVVEPFYPRAGNGRPPIGLERMLRLHFLQHWFNLSDPAAEEALYDSLSMRRFVGIDLGREPVPDETTILNFRHLLERHDLGKPLFDRVNEHLASRGLKVSRPPLHQDAWLCATREADRRRSVVSARTVPSCSDAALTCSAPDTVGRPRRMAIFRSCLIRTVRFTKSRCRTISAGTRSLDFRR